MSVKIYPKPVGYLNSRHEASENEFLNLFNTIGVEVLEPMCPFCGKDLHNAKCNCSSFTSALKSFLSTFKDQNVDVKLENKPITRLYSLSQDNVTEQLVPNTKFNLLFCETGTICGSGTKDVNEEFWFVSLGKIKDGKMFFLVRKFGHDTIYKYQMSDIDCPDISLHKVLVYTPEQNFIPGRSRRIGDYHIEHKIRTIKEIPYMEFLKHLEEIKYNE